MCGGGGVGECWRRRLKPGLAGISDSGHQAHPACLGLEMLSIVALCQDTQGNMPPLTALGENKMKCLNKSPHQ